MIFRPTFTIEEEVTFIKHLLASIFTKASLLMWWIIKLKIYVVLTGMVNPHYIKTQEVNKEKTLTELTDFAKKGIETPS